MDFRATRVRGDLFATAPSRGVRRDRWGLAPTATRKSRYRIFWIGLLRGLSLAPTVADHDVSQRLGKVDSRLAFSFPAAADPTYLDSSRLGELPTRRGSHPAAAGPTAREGELNLRLL